jgi:hypothetical protein
MLSLDIMKTTNAPTIQVHPVTGLVTKLFKSDAAQRRGSQADRDALITELAQRYPDQKWALEGPMRGDKYLASNFEMTRWVNEARRKAGVAELPQVIYGREQ